MAQDHPTRKVPLPDSGRLPPEQAARDSSPGTVSSNAPPARPSFIEPDWLEEDTSVGPPTQAQIGVASTPPERDRALLMMLSGLNAGQVFALDEDETVIGRGREVAIRIDDPGISRRHTRIFHTLEGVYMVEDLGSTNGTYVNGQRVERVELRSSDRVQVGPNALLRFSLIDAAEESLARQLYEASTRDALTRAYNRRYFAERVAAEVAYAHRHRARVSLLLFDLDRFKDINDVHGHLAGDAVLRAVAGQVTRLIRAEDVFARYGGEEFVILVRGIEHANATRFAERIRKAIAALPVAFDAATLKVTVSFGVASLDECGELATDKLLLLRADERLYRAKNAGRNCVVSE